MAYKDLNEFIRVLKKNKELVRITEPVSPILEITEIVDRVSKKGGPALLFENVVGHDMPVAINLFGSAKRMNLALEVDSLDSLAQRVISFLDMEKPEGFMDKIRMLPRLKQMGDVFPKTVKNGPCQEVVHTEDIDISKMPVLKCWPGDGGRFITMPLVITKHPETGQTNMGMYRMQIFDKSTTGMHWHPHKGGAHHYRVAQRRGERLEAAVAIGADPATCYTATAPLPDDVDELMLAGFLRRKHVELVQCLTVDLKVPANAQIVLEGYVEPGEKRREGPFGDHTGFYSLADDFPVFHVTCMTHRKDPIYAATIVGRPPMEDGFLGKATERLFLPILQKTLNEVVDYNLPVEGVFHNFALVSIDKRYPGHARKVMHALWGLGQMMFAKFIVVFDKEVNVRDLSEAMWYLGNNVDPQRDVCFVTGPVDALDHASPLPNLGSKMGIDATRKWPEEGHNREWPDVITMDPAVVQKIDGLWSKLKLD
jgi:4-hydroxy-3-polyprenylbenzoate decarboxylase